MLIIDDLLAAPVNGLLWVFKEIQKQAAEEQRNRREAIMASLSALYVALEQGQLTEEDFDAREQSLLDELDRLDAQDEEDEDEEEEEEEEEEKEENVSDADIGVTADAGAIEPNPEYALKMIPAEKAADGPGVSPSPPKGPEESRKEILS
jgi:hypothetical protein